MSAVEYQTSAFAPWRMVRQIRELMPAAIDAVEQRLGESVPPLTVAIGGSTFIATSQLIASGRRGASYRNVVAFWRHRRREAREIFGLAQASSTGRTLVAIHTDVQSCPHELWPTLIHELVHTVQHARPGRRTELLAQLDNDLRVSPHPPVMRHALDAVTAIEEAEAYAVQYALAPGGDSEPAWDRHPVHARLQSAASHWAKAVSSL